MRFRFLFILLFAVFSSFLSQEDRESHENPEQMFKQWLRGVEKRKLQDFKVGYSQLYWNSLSKKERKELLKK